MDPTVLGVGVGAALSGVAYAVDRALAGRASRRTARVPGQDRAASTTTSRRQSVETIYDLACAHLGHPRWKAPTRPVKPQQQRGGRSRGLFDQMVDSAVDGLVEKGTARLEDRTGRSTDVARTVKVQGWLPDGTPGATSVRFPAGTDTSPGSKARGLWEAGWTERFGRSWVFRFDWPANETVVRMTPTRPRRALPEHVDWTDDPERPWNEFTVGMSELGPIRWNVLHHPHGLSGGKTRSGKTAAIRVRVLEALRSGWDVYICDPKGVDFAWCAVWDGDDRITHLRQGVKAVGVDTADIVHVLTLAETEMAARKKLMRKAGVVNYPQLRAACVRDGLPVPPPILVVVDEAAVFIGAGQDDQEKALRERAQSAAGLIASQGAGLGMTLDLATQFPYADILKRWRGNLDFANAVSRLRGTESELVLGSRSAQDTPTRKRDGVSPLPGRAVVRLGDEVAVQLAYVSDEMLEVWAPPFVEVPRAAAPTARRPSAPILVPVDTDPDDTAADREPQPEQPSGGIRRAW